MMKQKLSILSALICLFAVSAWANTTDKVTLSETVLDRGGEYKVVTVDFVGTENTVDAYTAIQADIYLPSGYEFVQVANGDGDLEYASNGSACKSTHGTASAIQKGTGALRISVLSSKTAVFKTGETQLFQFYVKANSYAKPGFADIEIKDYFFVKSDGTKCYSDDETVGDKVSVSSSCSLPLTISKDNKWATCVFPFNATIPSGLKVYTCETADDEFAYLSTQSTINAYTPYVVYAEKGFDDTVKGTADASDYPTTESCQKGLLIGGTLAPIKATTGYILQKHDGDELPKFYQIATNDSFTIPTGKCYLTTGTGDTAAKLSIAFEGETDGINGVNADANAGAIYDLQGRKIEHPRQNGIYIVNGKTVIKK